MLFSGTRTTRVATEREERVMETIQRIDPRRIVGDDSKLLSELQFS